MPTKKVRQSRVVVIGLDGATFDLLLPWLQEGRLPNLAAIWARSTHGYLRSTIPPVTAAAWASFQTGKNPGKHGLFDFTEHRPGSYDTHFTNAQSIQGEILWDTLSGNGKRVVVVNVPVTYPPRAVNGFLIPGLLTPSRERDAAYPHGLYQEIINETGSYEIFVSARAVSYMGVQDFVEKLRQVTRKRAEAALFLMRRAKWDFCMVHFQSTDVLQHALWSHLDPGHPEYESIAEEERAYVQDYYRDLDRLVGQLLDEAGGGVTVIVMSDHGFGPLYRCFHVNQWLAGEGLLRVRTGKMYRRALDSVETTLRRAGWLQHVRRVISPRGRVETVLRRFTEESLIDWSATKAFALPCSSFIRLQINCRGREALGIVDQGAEYDRLREEIAERLLDVRDLQTGSRVVEHVFRREETYSGPALKLMPDLVAEPVSGYQVGTRVRGNCVFDAVPKPYTGGHRMDGILMIAGDHIVPKRRIEGAEIVDLHPTILYLLGCSLPAGLDGRVLTEALDRSFVEENPVRQERGSSCSRRVGTGSAYSLEDAREIRHRLGGLGYLEE
jgi:predicted AlkP superfamily phosphohydrolase/phosphomutase